MKELKLKMKSVIRIVLLIVMMLVFQSCSEIEQNVGVSISEENIVEVSIRNSEFSPNNVLITAGTTVFWTNYDSQGHTITSENYFDSKTISRGQSFSHKFDEIGEFEYNCKIHEDMIGMIIVQ